jgi:hypothetical protein
LTAGGNPGGAGTPGGLAIGVPLPESDEGGGGGIELILDFVNQFFKIFLFL